MDDRRRVGGRLLLGGAGVLVPTAVVVGGAAVYAAWGWGVPTAWGLTASAVSVAVGLWWWGGRRAEGRPRPGRRWPALAAVCCAGLAVLGAGSALDATRRQASEALVDAGRTRLSLELVASPATAGDVLLASSRITAGVGRGAVVLAVVPLDRVRERADWDRGTRVTGWFAASQVSERGPEAARVRLVSSPSSGPRPAGDVLSAQRRALTALYRGGDADGGAALVPGMVAGDRSLQSTRLSDAMTQAGLSHVTAVSGSNISVLISAVAGLGRVLRLARSAAALLSVGAVGAFVVLVGPDPPVLRAAVMGALAAVAVVAGRPRVGVVLVAAAAAVLVCADPWQVTRVGFRLSVAACLGIALLGPTLTGLLQRIHVPRVLAESVSVSVAATLACTPDLVLLSSEQSPLIVPVNVVAAPFVVVVGTVGPLLLLLAPLGPLICLPLVEVCRLCAQVVAWLGVLTAERGPRLTWPEAPWGPVLAVAGCWVVPGMIAGWGRRLLASREGRREAVPAVVRRGVSAVTDRFGAVMVRLGLRGRRRGARRRAVLVVTVTLLAAGVGAVAGTAPSVRGLLGLPAQARAALPGDVVLCDVGQGDAVVAVAESGRGVLLDAGPRDGDVGACLDRAGVGHLCAAVVSHLDADHVGGLTAALERAPADAVIYGTAGRRAPTRTAERGVTGRSVECAPWTVTVVRAPDAAEENDASLVVRAVTDVGEGIDLLTAGDAEEAAGTAAVADGVAEPSGDRTRLLKISHHGSANGGTDLMRSFLPEVALIGVGEDNDYGHPSPKILDALRARSVPVLRTDQDGTVLLRSTDQGLRVVRHE